MLFLSLPFQTVQPIRLFLLSLPLCASGFLPAPLPFQTSLLLPLSF
jgi:hypothetical protein